MLHLAAQALAERWPAWWPLAGRGLGRRADIARVRLGQALEKSGCPICVLALEQEARRLWVFLWENINDPWIRADFRGSLGFCPAHTSRLDRIARSEGLGALGQAILAQDVIQTVVERLVRAPARGAQAIRAALDTRAGCPACARRAQGERDDLVALCRWLSEAAFQALYERSEGLCLPHLLALPLRSPTDRLLEHGMRYLERLAERASITAGPVRPADGVGIFWVWSGQAAAWPPGPFACLLCRHQLAAERSAANGVSQPGEVGFVCPQHAAWLLAAPEAPAYLAEGHRRGIEAALRELERRRSLISGGVSWPRLWRSCPPGLAAGADKPRCSICEAGAEAVLEAFRRGVTPEAGGLLCLPHLRASIAWPGGANAVLVAAQAAALFDLAASLGEYIRKSGWAHRHEPRGEEQTSWQRARAFLVGPGRPVPRLALTRPRPNGIECLEDVSVNSRNSWWPAR